MIRHLLISSAFILASTVTFITSASAEEPSVMAYGSVADFCDFSNPLPGDLVLNSGGTALSSIGGTPAKVNIDCNGNAKLTISKPQQKTGLTGKTEFLPLNLTATAKNTALGLDINSESTQGGNIFANSEGEAIGTIEVNMTANNGSGNKISPGEYEFTVTLTSTP